MHHPLTILAAQALEEDARRAGERQARLFEAEAAKRAAGPDAAITIREAKPHDASALARLASLALSELPPRPMLLAEVDGRVCAAVSVLNGWSVSDPRHRGAGIIELLSLRASQVRGDDRRPGLLRRLLRPSSARHPHRLDQPPY